MIWKTWEPAFIGINYGAGSVNARYRFDGIKIYAQIEIKMGIGCSVGYNPSFSLPVPSEPVNARYGPRGGEVGSAYVGGTVYPLIVVANDTSVMSSLFFFWDTVTASFALQTSIRPATWDSNSTLGVEFSYYPASTILPNTFSAVGDSVTAWRPEQNWNTSTSSWTNYVPSSGLIFGGGWAKGGSTSQWMLDNKRTVQADNLVIMAGLNDIYQSIPSAQTISNISAIASSAPASKITISAIPPYNPNPVAAAALNSSLVSLVSANPGWQYVDPWSGVRACDGRYVSGADVDGVHPTVATQKTAGTSIRNALV